MNRAVQIDLDVAKVTDNVDEIAVLQQGESEALTIEATVLVDGEPFDLTGASASFICKRPDGTWFHDDAVDCGSESNTLTYHVAAAVAKAYGTIHVAYFAISDQDGHVHTTDNFVLKVTAGCTAEDVEKTDEYKTITELIAELAAVKDEYSAAVADAKFAATSASSSASSATSAASSATSAASAANSAAAKANAAATTVQETYEEAEAARDTAYAAAEAERDAQFEADMAAWAERVQTLSEFFYIDEDGDLCQHD